MLTTTSSTERCDLPELFSFVRGGGGGGGGGGGDVGKGGEKVEGECW